jgi:N utilization substance protein A
VGDRVLVAVHSHDLSVDPVSVCTGKAAIHSKIMVRELGEAVSIILWSESPESFVLHAIGSLGPSAVRTPKVRLDAAAHCARVVVGRETLEYFSAQGDSRLRLASQLVGWEIQIVSHERD